MRGRRGPLARHREPARRNPGEIGSDQHLSPAAAPEGRIRDRAASVILNVDRSLVDDYANNMTVFDRPVCPRIE